MLRNRWEIDRNTVCGRAFAALGCCIRMLANELLLANVVSAIGARSAETLSTDTVAILGSADPFR